MAKRVRQITGEDIHFYSCYRHCKYRSFHVELITEKILPDSAMYSMAAHIEEKGYECDEMNMEYMGFLTGIIGLNVEKEELAVVINEFLKKIAIGE